MEDQIINTYKKLNRVSILPRKSIIKKDRYNKLTSYINCTISLFIDHNYIDCILFAGRARRELEKLKRFKQNFDEEYFSLCEEYLELLFQFMWRECV